MKKVKLMLGILAVSVCLCACTGAKQAQSNSKKETKTKEESQTKKEPQTEEKIYQTLTAEQKDYLASLGYTEDGINEMDYEAVNFYLLGTGFELYNPSSGVEIFGVTYQRPASDKNKQYVSMKSGSKMITYAQALSIREKEKEMRVDDFLNYRCEIEKIKNDTKEETRYSLFAPIQGYKDTYVLVIFTEKKNGEVHMNAPMIHYKKSLTDGSHFSFYYQSPLKDSFYEDPMHPDEKNENKKVYYGVQYSSVTDKSIVIEMLNNTDVDYTLNDSFKLYKVEGKKETLCKEYQGEHKDAVRKNSYRIESVPLDQDGKKLSAGDYCIEYGKQGEHSIYTKLNFSVD